MQIARGCCLHSYHLGRIDWGSRSFVVQWRAEYAFNEFPFGVILTAERIDPIVEATRDFSSTEMIWWSTAAADPGRMTRFVLLDGAQPSQSHHADATYPAILPFRAVKREAERKELKRIHYTNTSVTTLTASASFLGPGLRSSLAMT